MTFSDADLKRLKERFWAKVNKTYTCWVWVGSKGSNGYGQMWDGKRLRPAHRLSYEWFVGPIPDGLTIDHVCQNPPCVRPEHLQAITMIDNIMLGSKIQNTHCPKGHPFSDENTFYINLSRSCRICKRDCDKRQWVKHGTQYRARKRLQYLRDKDTILAKQKVYYEANKEKILARQMVYQGPRTSGKAGD